MSRASLVVPSVPREFPSRLRQLQQQKLACDIVMNLYAESPTAVLLLDPKMGAVSVPISAYV